MGDRDYERESDESHASDSSHGSEQALAHEQKMQRAMKMVGGNASHREMFDMDPVGYLQRLGISPSAADLGKLGLQTETLAALDGGGEKLQFTMFSLTVTPASTAFTVTPGGGGNDPSKMTITLTCGGTLSNPTPTAGGPTASVTLTYQTAMP